MLILSVSPAHLFAGEEDSLLVLYESAGTAEKYKLLKNLSDLFRKDSSERSIHYLEKRLDLAESNNNIREEINSLVFLGDDHWYKKKIKAAAGYYREALARARTVNDEEESVVLLNMIGMCHYEVGEYDSSLIYYEEALEIRSRHENLQQSAKILNNMGTVYSRTGNYEKAQEYNLEALTIKEMLLGEADGDSALMAEARSNVAKSLINIGSTYSMMGNVHKALEYFTRALPVAEELNRKNLEGMILNNIGTMFNQLGKYHEALEHHQRSLRIREITGDIKGTSVSYNNIANVYYNLNNYSKALEYYKKSLNIKREISDQYGVANTMKNIGRLFLAADDPAKAGRYLKDALKIAQTIHAQGTVSECYKYLAEYYYSAGDYKRGYRFLGSYEMMADSLYSAEHSRKIAELQVRYESRKKERDNELLRKEVEVNRLDLKRQKNIRNFLLIFPMLIMGTGGVVYSRYKLKKKAESDLRKKNILLENHIRKLTESESRLQELNATREKLFRVISHDIKNPLGSYVSLMNILGENYPVMAGEEKGEFIENAGKSARITLNLLETLSQWSELQSSRSKPEQVRVDLCKLTSDSLETVKLDAEKKKITLSNELESGTYIEAEEQLLSSVLRNLLTNAVKFTQENGKVLVSLDRGKDEWVISVSDNGIGMNEEDVGKLFRADTNYAAIGRSPEKGTGLGLIICKEAVQRLGGRIWAESKEGSGTTFSFSVPVKTGEGRV